MEMKSNNKIYNKRKIFLNYFSNLKGKEEKVLELKIDGREDKLEKEYSFNHC